MFQMLNIATVFVAHNFITNIHCGRILVVVPTPSISHQVVFRPLTQELVKRGHEVVVITTDPAFPKDNIPANLTEIDVHDISYAKWTEFVKTVDGKKSSLYKQVENLINLFSNVFEEQIQSEQVKRIIEDKNQYFDLLLIEACVRPAMVFSHLYDAPAILMSSFGFVFDAEITIGASRNPIYYPPMIKQKLNDITIWDKLKDMFIEVVMRHMSIVHEDVDHEMLKRYFGSDVPSLRELYENVEMVFVNVHSIWDNNRPVPSNAVYLSGMHRKPERDLPKDLKSYLDSSVHGVIYISFGTNTKPSLLPPEKIQTIINAFSQMPYDILWKWDKDELPGRSKNIRISKWFPQSDLLRHPKIKLFITQGGLQSTDEAIIAGVPLVGIPMLGDQWYNVEKYVKHNIGVRLDLESLTETKLMNAINTVIEDESYRQNIAKLRSVIHDQPQSPLERAVWWTEHVLRHGGARHLRAPAANMSWTQYLELEFFFTLLISVLVIIFVSVVVLYYIVKFVTRKLMYSVKFKKY